MNKIEALRKEADLREMCEGTGMPWWACVKFNGHTNCVHLNNLPEDIDAEIALAIVENKPVFAGDELYRVFDGSTYYVSSDLKGYEHNLSWKPPRPKTVMVELLVEDVEEYAQYDKALVEKVARIGKACRKALEQLNGGGE